MLFLDQLHNALEGGTYCVRLVRNECYVGFAGLIRLWAAGGRVAGYRNGVGEQQ